MAGVPPSCLRCGGTMSEGYVVDVGYGSTSVPKWVEGSPVKSIWTGLKLRGKEQLSVTSFRCRRCGYLESYA